jgi:hypothetical protein
MSIEAYTVTGFLHLHVSQTEDMKIKIEKSTMVLPFDFSNENRNKPYDLKSKFRYIYKFPHTWHKQIFCFKWLITWRNIWIMDGLRSEICVVHVHDKKSQLCQLSYILPRLLWRSKESRIHYFATNARLLEKWCTSLYTTSINFSEFIYENKNVLVNFTPWI